MATNTKEQAIHCVTCEQPVSKEVAEHIYYFAQESLCPKTDDASNFVSETRNLIRYMRTVFKTLTVTKGHSAFDEHTIYDLNDLGWALAEEAMRRVELAFDAAELQWTEIHDRGKARDEAPARKEA